MELTKQETKQAATPAERRKASEYPQELLNLFDLYVHGEISRRTFLDGAQKFAVGGVTAVALWESLRPNYAFAQQVKPDDKRIKVSYETVASPKGNGSIKGYFARPAKKGKYPAIIVIHENRGLNPYIEDVARRLATDNFIAFAPDGLTPLGKRGGFGICAEHLARHVRRLPWRARSRRRPRPAPCRASRF